MRVAFSHCPVLALGPGRRFGLWLQGCSRNCPGCMSGQYKPYNMPSTRWAAPEELGREIIIACKDFDCGGITISGGEPFEQAVELRQLCAYLHSRNLEDILVYSGFAAEYLLALYPWIEDLIGCVIDGPFMENFPTEAVWKGSGNQQAWIFNNVQKYRKWLTENKNSLQIVTDAQNVHIIGIPRMGDANILLGG